ncbi:LamG domain-containing protein [Hugenholtzia roseola]|uniref:LamG domain-containing protein n=1 Tax=Hugenholtzia roseola TaxID=1002 RepID=UPI0013772B3F|nr:LamG domain-containing protein [Hugenholtzia roseola]
MATTLFSCGTDQDEDVFNGTFFGNIGSSNAAPDIERGLMLNLSFDEGSTKDFSGNDNSANVRGTVKLTTDRKGRGDRAAYFEGNGSLEVPHTNTLVLGNNFSVSFFFKTQTFAEGYLLIKGDDRDINVDKSTFRIMTLQSFNNIFADAFYPERVGYFVPFQNNTNWQHFVLTSNNQRLDAYINGVLVATSPVSGSLRRNTDPIRIGCRMFNGQLQNYYIGALDEVRIYNRTLNQAEILLLYQQD